MAEKKKRKKNKKVKKAGLIIGRVVLVISTTLFLFVFFLIGVLTIVMRGPSEDAARLFALSAHETSAMKWVPAVFMGEERYEAILNPVSDAPAMMIGTASQSGNDGNDFVPLKVAGASTDSNESGEDYDNQEELLVVDIKGATYKGKLMIVKDPRRVVFASIDSFGGVGITLSEFLEKYDAIGCVNAGGFEDEGGKGKGGIPDGIVIRDGAIAYGNAGTRYKAVMGFDKDYVLHVGDMTGQEALDMGIINGTNFANGPVLIQDGVRQSGFVSGINPRTCVGQREDGTMLLLAVEGRLADSLGATFDDLTDIMEEYGAINAGNFDGGSSSGMYYEGERITRSCSVIGDRPLPTAVVVLR